MKLTAPWLRDPGTGAVFDLLEGGGHRAWYVGGCVRNALLGVAVKDLDICTDAVPQRVLDLAEAADLRAIPTGIDHGTVTLIAGGEPHEVTTLRHDVETDGRHARVRFSDRLEDDAARRDFTMNALYATRDGLVLDPTGQGIADLEARRLRFIGPAPDRIREDYLRILRFFRFHAWYADPAGGLDESALAAIADHLDGLPRLSRERVGAEVTRLLAAPEPAPAVAAMAASGVLSAILPGAVPDLLLVLTTLDAPFPPDPIRRLAALGGTDVPDRLRLSKADAKRLALYTQHIASTEPPGALGYRHGLDAARDIVLLRGAALGNPDLHAPMAEAATGARAVFPLKAADLPDLEGAALGRRLRKLESAWVDSGFTLTKPQLLA